MKNFIVILILLSFSFAHLAAQTDTTKTSNWTKKGHVGLQMNQIYFNNWVQGGDKNFTTSAFFRYEANLKTDSYTLENLIDMGIGFNWTEENEWRKNQDKIELNSKFGMKAFNKVNWAAQLNFKSQFIEGYNFPGDTARVRVSNFLAPAWLNISVGLDWKPNDNFSLFYSPVSGRVIFVLDSALSAQGAYGVAKDELIRPELGSNLVAIANGEIFKNISINSKLELFMNYTPEVKSEITNIDVNWETNTIFKVNSILSFNLFIHMIYDHDIIQQLQLRQISGMGISVKF